MTSETYNLLQ